jgi:hypothetical protein
MTILAANSHVLVWKHASNGLAGGGDARARGGWLTYVRQAGETRFTKALQVQDMSDAVGFALSGAIFERRNVSVAWGVDHPDSVDAQTLETKLLTSATNFIGPERRPSPFNVGDAWLWCASGVVLSRGGGVALQEWLMAGLESWCPPWQHGKLFDPKSLALRHDVTAEERGFVPPLEITPNMVLNLVMDDSEVRHALLRRDPTVPASFRDFTAAVLRAQAAIGILEDDQVPIYTDEAQRLVMLALGQMGSYEVRAAAAWKEVRRLYGDLAGPVMAYAVRTFRPQEMISDQMRAALMSVMKKAA